MTAQGARLLAKHMLISGIWHVMRSPSPAGPRQHVDKMPRWAANEYVVHPAANGMLHTGSVLLIEAPDCFPRTDAQ